MLVALAGAVIFIPFIGNCHLFDWDEVNFAECAREMIVSGNYSRVQLNFRPFWEKPPLFIWMQALSMNVFGVNEFAARLPNALCGMFSLVSLFLIGTRFHSARFGLIWCALYTCSLLPHFYFKSGIIDPWFNLFIFLSLYNTFLFLHNPLGKKELLNSLLGGFFLGAAVLTKGPVALGIAGLSILAYLVWNRQLALLRTRLFVLFFLSTLVVASTWFLVEWLKGNGTVIREFISYHIRLFNTPDAGHEGPFAYHFIVLLIGCFPASLLFLSSYFNFRGLTPYQRQLRKMFICLFWVVLLLFSMVSTKIVHYSSLCYFPLTFVGAIGLTNQFHEKTIRPFFKVLFWIVAGMIALASITIGLFKYLQPWVLRSGWIEDSFTLANLSARVHWTGFEFLIGFVFLAGSFFIYRGLSSRKLHHVYTGLVINFVFIWMAVLVFIPKIEAYSQGAPVDFYKAKAKEHCYVETHGFKSYAYLFYSDRKPSDYVNPDQHQYIEERLTQMERQGYSRMKSYALANLFWMEYGIIDRPAYIVAKNTSLEELARVPGLKFLYEKNGFVFYVREPSEPVR